MVQASRVLARDLKAQCKAGGSPALDVERQRLLGLMDGNHYFR